MIKYKIIQVTGNKREIAENKSIEFDSIYSARKKFDSIDVYQELLQDWSETSEVVHKALIAQDAFLEYDLVEYDNEDEFTKIYLRRKSMCFRNIM